MTSVTGGALQSRPLAIAGRLFVVNKLIRIFFVLTVAVITVALLRSMV